jgi:hypothetical protein
MKKGVRYRKFIFFSIIFSLLLFNIGSSIDNKILRNYEPKYDLLIIAPFEFRDLLNPLVDHKEQFGISTFLQNLEDIYTDNRIQGRDNPEKIKYKIKEFYDKYNINYVLLIGGKKGQTSQWYLPVRYVFMENDWIKYYEPYYISDLYYADIYEKNGNFSSWDSDNDNIYGEWYSGEFAEDYDIDLYPDVAVGRLPCRNKYEVEIMVNKIIDYETNTFGKSWFYDMQVFAGDTMPDYPLINSNVRVTDFTNPDYEGEYYGEIALSFMKGFNAHRYYTSDGSLTFINDVINALSRGAGFSYFIGHGSPQMWGTYTPNGDKFAIGLLVQIIHKIQNENRYPITILSGCHCCKFDVSILKVFDKKSRENMEATLECLGWRLTSKPDGGSIATIGCTALGALKEDKTSLTGGGNELEVNFFKQYGKNNIKFLGEAWQESISWYIDSYLINWKTPAVSDSWIDAQVVQSWILFGDPSLMIGGYNSYSSGI